MKHLNLRQVRCVFDSIHAIDHSIDVATKEFAKSRVWQGGAVEVLIYNAGIVGGVGRLDYRSTPYRDIIRPTRAPPFRVRPRHA